MLQARPRSWLRLLTVSAIVSLFLLFNVRWDSGSWAREAISTYYGSKQLDTKVPPYTAAIIYLAQTEFGRHNDLIHSITDIHFNLPAYPWPIIIFHSGSYNDPELRTNLTEEIHHSVREDRGSRELVNRIEFIELEWKLPEGVSEDINVIDPIFPGRWPGYHHMCAFFTSKIFDHPRIRNLTFYLRMDTDSFIPEPVCYDPIDVMYKKNLVYGWRYLGQDPGWAVKGLWALLNDYSRAHPAVENMLAKNKWNWPAVRTPEGMVEESFTGYYNNFEIVRVEAFHRPDIQDWFATIREDPLRHYKWRWGDGPIRYATVNMFFDIETEVQEFCAVPFYHQWRIEGQCPCEQLA